MKRQITLILGGMFGLVAVVAGLFWAFNLYPTGRAFEPTILPSPSDRSEAIRQDLTALRKLPDIDRAFTPAARVAFEREIDELSQRAGTLDPARFELGVARAVALADNAHTNARGITYGVGFNVLPLRLAWFSDGLYVVAAQGALKEIVGARVTELDGHDPESLATRFAQYVGGPPQYRRRFALNLMVTPEAMMAAGVGRSPTSIELRLVLRDGRSMRRLFPVGSSPMWRSLGPGMAPENALNPARGEAVPEGWAHVLDAVTAPLAMQNAERWYWKTWPDAETLYVQIDRVISANDGLGLDGFLAGALAEAEAKKPRYAIVDLRMAPGGNYLLTSDFANRLPQLIRSDGKIFILVSPVTFSAALVTAARLKHFAGERGIMIGESMGDRPIFWAEGGVGVLPNSKLAIRYSTAWHDWKSGCALTDFSRCYWLNILKGVAAGNLDPAVETPSTFQDYAAGHDPAMEAVERLKQ